MNLPRPHAVKLSSDLVCVLICVCACGSLLSFFSIIKLPLFYVQCDFMAHLAIVPCPNFCEYICVYVFSCFFVYSSCFLCYSHHIHLLTFLCPF